MNHNQLPESSLPDITTPTPRRSWPRRHKVWTGILTFIGVIVIFGILGGIFGSTSTTTTLHPSTSATPSVTVPVAAPVPTPTVPDTMRLPLGTPMDITQGGTDAATITVTSVKVFTTPADQYGEPPQNGYYVVAHVSARTLNGFTGGFDIYSGDFYVKESGQHFSEGDSNAFYALAGSQEDLGSTTLAAGEHTRGLLVFDVPNPHGQIVYAPNLDGQPLGSWKF
jgi:hypothetical protein